MRTAPYLLGLFALFALCAPFARADSTPASGSRSKARRTNPKLYPTPPPDKWTAAQRKQLELVRAHCAPVYEAQTRPGHAPRIGCGACEANTPADVTLPAKPVDQVAEWVQNFSEGSFTHSGAKEAAVQLVGCGMRSEGGGGTYLLVEHDAAWQVASYTPGATQCKPLPLSTGRVALLCTQAYPQGNTLSWNLTRWDFNESGALPTELVEFDSVQVLASEVCTLPDSGPLSEVHLNLPEVVSAADGTVTDVTLEVDYLTLSRDALAKLKLSARFAASCGCAEKMLRGSAPPPGGCPSLGLPHSVHARLDFILRGEQLRPTIGTERLLRAFSAQRQF